MKIDFSFQVSDLVLSIDVSIIKESKLRASESGYVYLVRRAPETFRDDRVVGYRYKIGQTRHLRKRLKTISSGSSMPLEIVQVVAVSSPEKVEAALHETFRTKNIEGEWFSLDERDVSLLTNLVLLIGRPIRIETPMIVSDNHKIPPLTLLSNQAVLEFFDFGLERNFAIVKMFRAQLPCGLYVSKSMWKRATERLKELGILCQVGHGHKLLVKPDEAREILLRTLVTKVGK